MKTLGAVLLVAVFGCATAGTGAPGATFQAGTARAKITPPEPGFMSGYGSRGTKPAERTETDLWLRALALDDGAGATAVIVSADILGFPPALARKIRDQARARHGLDDAHLMLAASHTHGGPALPERPSPEIFFGLDAEQQRRVDAYGEWLAGKVLEVIGQALARREPVRLSFARGEAHFGINRRLPQPNGAIRLADNKDGVTDPDVPVLWLHGRDGGVRAVVFTYACHGTTLGDVMAYHADWIGYASDALERALPGATALFVDGAAGDINPSPRGSFALARQHGEAAAAAVLATRPGTGVLRVLSGPLRAAYTRIELPLGDAPPRDLLEKAQTDSNGARSRHARVMLGLTDASAVPRAVPLPLQVWRFGGDLTLVALGGEVTVEYALRLKRELGAPTTWVAAYANEVPCYVPSEKVLAESGYEAGWDVNGPGGRALASGSMTFYGWPVPFAPGLEDRIVAAVRALVSR
jgi:hypothetical protein